jgi:predicted O-linked N-acetylglucosamine transferase (SPINDLY family)
MAQTLLADGWRALQRNDARTAEGIARSALRANPQAMEFVELLAASYYRQGRFQEAIAPLKAVFDRLAPRGAGYNLGYCYLATGDERSAETVLRNEVARYPDAVESQNLLGVLLARQRRHEEALAVFTAAIKRQPGYGGTYNNLGNTLSELGRHEEAVPYLKKAIKIQPADAQAHCNLGNAYRALGRLDDAAASVGRALKIAPDDSEAHNSLGVIHRDRGRYDEAVGCFQRAVAIDPAHAPAWHNLGLALDHLNQHEQALHSLQKALALRPDPETLVGLGNALQKLGRLDAAVSNYREAIALQNGLVSAHSGLGTALQDMKRPDEAAACFERVLAIDPGDENAPTALAWARATGCDWRDYEARVQALRRDVKEGRSVVAPFTFLALCQDLEEQRLCAERYLADKIPHAPPALARSGASGDGRIRLAYLSADFREHPVAQCIHELLRIHDRSRFEVVGVSLGAEDASDLRAKLKASFDRYIDVRRMGDTEAAAAIRDLGVDIAVDLMGFTKGCRPGILAHRPAAVQVAYLGYPGTTGARFIDYLLADRFVIPEDHERHYAERVVALPDSYMANHSLRVMGEAPSRAAAGLPEDAFVFCSFNNFYKITPEVFGVWMRLLQKVEGSVLWLHSDSAVGERNLGREAAARGVDPGRLVYARRVNRIEDHYARYRLADLFLDTRYNAHVTACDALWAGLPLLTCTGNSFATRVAGGLLRVLGLPELVTADLADYERAALALATDPERLRAVREKVGRARETAPLFDADRFRRHIESAFTAMWEIHRRGEPPRALAVPREP